MLGEVNPLNGFLLPRKVNPWFTKKLLGEKFVEKPHLILLDIQLYHDHYHPLISLAIYQNSSMKIWTLQKLVFCMVYTL